MFAKMLDGPFFVLTDHLKGDRKEQACFHSALGKAYQDYAHQLAERIALKDQRGAWGVWPDPGSDHAQHSDSYFQRDNVGIAMEHKGGRVETDFLVGGDGRRVVGPDSDLMHRLEAGEKISPRDGRKSDEGLLTKPMWQQSAAADSLMSWAEGKTGIRPAQVFPIITYLAHIFVDDWVRNGYLDELARRANLYSTPGWRAPQWLSVADLECLAAIADVGCLDLLRVLEAKGKEPDLRFDIFMRRRYSFVGDRRVHAAALQILERAKRRYWP